MKLTFLGGAESIGASCSVLEIDGERWVIDCGIRMKGSGGERLPDLGLLEEIGPPTAILVTHAHLDHIGALPVLSQRFPLVPVYATPPTIDLTRVQLLDSLKIMAEESEAEGELPLYSRASVEALLGRMIPVTPLRPVHPGGGNCEVTFFPAGHIIGACSLGISAPEGRVFISGDISVDNQRTIPGMRPPRFRAEVAVFESTYGKRLHASRSEEERRLVTTVEETIAAGGKVLIPAFAIGRAQEVLLILLRAQLANEIPRFPIWVDGMVRKACDIYATNPSYLQSTLRRRIAKHGDPFFDMLDNVQPVRSPSERAEILAGEPAVIVSSSGMLTGGPSPFYASALAADERSLIAITGYQDEEAPGRRLLDVAAGREDSLTLGDASVNVRCRVSTYALSGHASGAQIAAIVAAIRARDVFLVHGDAAARRDVAELLLQQRLGRVHLPQHSSPIELALGRAGSSSARERIDQRLRVTGIGKVQPTVPLDDEGATALASHIAETYREGTAFTVPELHHLWYGVDPAREGSLDEFETTLRSSGAFELHPTRLFQYVACRPSPSDGSSGVADVNALLSRIDAHEPAFVDLLKKSYEPGTTHMTLFFAFPDRAVREHGERLQRLFDESGWSFSISPQTNLAALTLHVREAIPDPRLVVGEPSIHLAERRVVVRLTRHLFEEELSDWEIATTQVLDNSGFTFELEVKEEAPLPKRRHDASGRLEVNLAYDVIRRAFAVEEHQPRKVGKKQMEGKELIELTFISEEVGVALSRATEFPRRRDRLATDCQHACGPKRYPPNGA